MAVVTTKKYNFNKPFEFKPVDTLEFYINPVCSKCKKKIKYNQLFTGVRRSKKMTKFYCSKCKVIEIK